MDLNDVASFSRLDSLDMLGQIDRLPDQLQSAWDLGLSLPKPWEGTRPSPTTIRSVVLSGMGGSAIGAELLTAYSASTCRLPVVVWRDYGLPAWAHGSSTLVIATSHSGDTEETLDTFDEADRRGCRLLVLCTGGELERRASSLSHPLWTFKHDGQSRAAIGFSFGLLLAAFSRLGLLEGLSPENLGASVASAVEAMRKQQQNLLAAVEVVRNPAKREAGQIMDHWVVVYGAGLMAPVARRWKGQINEIAKAGAGFELLPEADHNAMAGLLNPESLQTRTLTLFLRSSFDGSHNQLRTDLTRHGLMVEGLNTDVYEAQGDSPLAHLWTALHFGDYMAYYLAMIYGVDPTPVEALVNFKAAMKVAGGNSPH